MPSNITHVRCVTLKTNRERYIVRSLAENDLYMKRAGLMVAELNSPPKLSKAKQKEINDIDERIKGLAAGEQTDAVKSQIKDLQDLKNKI